MIAVLWFALAACDEVKKTVPAPVAVKSEEAPRIDTAAPAALLFGPDVPLAITVRAPIRFDVQTQKHIIVDPEPEHGQLPSVEIGAKRFPILLRARGNYSLLHCAMPKLALILGEGGAPGTPLEGVFAILINTHCDGDAQSLSAGYGREENTYREAFVYKVAGMVRGELTHKTRKARIDYQSTARDANFKAMAHKKAYFIESDEMLSERLRMVRIQGPQIAREYNKREWKQRFNKSAVMKTFLFEAMILNKDWRAKALHNVIALVPDSPRDDEETAGEVFLAPYDFDQSSIVMGGEGLWSNTLEGMREILATGIEEGFYTQAELAQEYRAWYCTLRDPIYAALERERALGDEGIDPEFYGRFKANLDVFFGALGRDYFPSPEAMGCAVPG